MLLHEDDDGVVCIGQASHAWVSGQLARRWGNDHFARPDPFDEVCLGAEQHDVGMAEWDLAPSLNPETGLPHSFIEMPMEAHAALWREAPKRLVTTSVYAAALVSLHGTRLYELREPTPEVASFLEMPLETHLRLWSAAPDKVLTQSPYAALIVSMHGRALYARRDTDEPGTDESRAVARFVAQQELYQQDLLANLGEDPARARRNQTLIWALDFLSLAPILGWVPDTLVAPTFPGEPDATLQVDAPDALSVTIDPWPFAEPELRIRYQGRRLTERFTREEDLHRALATAPWVTVTVTWRQATP